MNSLELTIKQMRQRALSTYLNILSVTLGVALVIAILILYREGNSVFGQSDFGYDVLVGVKGSPLQLTLNTVYHIDKSPGNIPYKVYDDLAHSRQYRRYVKNAVPIAVGDSYKGMRIVGTTPKMFAYTDEGERVEEGKRFEYRPGHSYELANGTMFNPNKFEAVIGSDIAKLTGLKVGDIFQATHGMPSPSETPDIHDEKWKVVGALKQTHTSADRVVYIPLNSIYTIAEHDIGEMQRGAIRRGENPATQKAEGDDVKHYTLNADGTINLQLPMNDREVSAILVQSRGAGGFLGQSLVFNLNLMPDVMAVNPASIMQEFFATFLNSSATVLLVIAGLVTIVAAASIMTTIYNSVAARRREIAILRALGATRGRVLGLICLEAGVVGLLGGLLGLLAGHLFGFAASRYLEANVGESINWIHVDAKEQLFLVGIVVLSLLAGLVPGLKAYRVSVADNLIAG